MNTLEVSLINVRQKIEMSVTVTHCDFFLLLVSMFKNNFSR